MCMPVIVAMSMARTVIMDVIVAMFMAASGVIVPRAGMIPGQCVFR